MDKNEEKEVLKVLKDLFDSQIKDNKELDIKGLDALVKMAIAQQKEIKNDEER